MSELMARLILSSCLIIPGSALKGSMEYLIPACFSVLTGDLQTENHQLKVELSNASERHKQDMVNAAQIQELAAMLQESHRSLVATNDHLLQELEEAKLRHSQELMQMNLNYEHLKKTFSLMHHS